MASRRYGHHHSRSPRRAHDYDYDYDGRRGPGPWQDGYRSYGDDPYTADGGRGYERHYADYDYRANEGYGRYPAREEYYGTDYRYGSTSEAYYPAEAYDTRYHEPSYADDHYRGYDAPYQASSRGYSEAARSDRYQPRDPSPSHHHHDSQRTMAPQRPRISTPPPPARPPSPAYLATANTPPARLPAPAAARKLLILDLNGTLVFRTALRGKARAQGGAPRLRTAHPRPYAPAFAAYLFAGPTRAWLDVMVWSSAQPHSVRGMVERVFGEEVYAACVKAGRVAGVPSEEGGGEGKGEGEGEGRPRLVAIWARDTLGLSESHYRQKVQTVKDLNIPWSKLPSILSPSPTTSPHPKPSRTPSPTLSRPPTPPPPSSPPSSSQASAPAPTSAPEPAATTVHSALTTLLLDDSPLKAARQPHNHVCIPEYDGVRRARDLGVFMRVSARVSSPTAAPAPPDPPADAASEAANSSADASPDAEDGAQESKKRKRIRKRAKKAAARGEEEQQEEEKEEEEEFDETLLAVVGVLDAVKWEANVAAWVRARGLWGPAAAVGGEAGSVEEDGRGAEERKRRKSGEVSEGNDGEGGGEGPRPMWFEDEETFGYWVQRGRRALEELGIAVEHGIER